MRPGQRLTRWWQEYVLGRLMTPQAIVAASRSEDPDPAKFDDRFFSLPPGGPVWDTPERLRAPAFLLSTNHMRQGERADWAHVDRRLMFWAALVVEYGRKRGIPLYVHCALRSEAEQAKVNAMGNSKAKYPRSAHNIGEAVDIVHGVFHWEMTRAEWAYIHVLGRLALDRVNAQLPKDDKLHLTWGGDFKSIWDPAHWEITDYRSRIRELPAAPVLRYMPRRILSAGL